MNATLGSCCRCAVPLRVATITPSTADMLRRATAPKGQCVNCAVREWFYVNRDAIVQPFEPHELLWEPVQVQYARIMQVGRADASPAEIDWEKVVRDWDLPIKAATTRLKSPKWLTRPK